MMCLSGYWETLLHQLKMFMARARLREFHQVMLRKKLDDLKRQVKQSLPNMLHCKVHELLLQYSQG